ncbi:MAG: FAD-dependent oxidoreductase, partial [Veillonella sp.]|nr:FAD-dependent oxidoreductase [Veillonella sp.]
MSNELKPLHFDADYTMEEALAEAKRCLNCPKPLCRMGCPIENEIPRFIQAIARGNFGEANDILAERTNLPSICGRVCPRENQCEGNCIMNKAKKPPINIGKLERFAADFESINELRKPKKIKQDLGKVAVVGSGPAGLSVAGDVAKLGYEVTVFEGQSEPGGVLLFGIPEFRLSKAVVRREIARLEGLGVKFVCNTFIGQDKTLDDLFAEGYDSIFIGTGTHIPQDVRMENDEVPGVFQAMYLLTNVQLVENGELDENQIPVKKGDRVIIIGGGNVAMDAARTCVRLGCEAVTVAYRRSQEQMPAL